MNAPEAALAQAGTVTAQPADGTGRPSLSVLIVTWNTRDRAISCIESVLRCTRAEAMEIIVVDNASDDGTADALRARFPQVQVIEAGENLGPGGGYNVAMRAARGDALMLLHSDTNVTDDVLGRMTSYLADAPDVALLGCELRFPDGRHQYTAFRRVGAWQSAVERFWLYRLLPSSRRARVLLGGYWPADEPTKADWLAGPQMVRREAFERTGGWSERLFFGGEETEWSLRLRRLGYRIMYEPQLGVIYHEGSASAAQMWSDTEMRRRWHRAGLEAYAVQHGRANALVYRMVETIGVSFRWAAYRVAHRLRPNPYHDSQARYYRTLAGFYLNLRETDLTGKSPRR